MSDYYLAFYIGGTIIVIDIYVNKQLFCIVRVFHLSNTMQKCIEGLQSQQYYDIYVWYEKMAKKNHLSVLTWNIGMDICNWHSEFPQYDYWLNNKLRDITNT